MRANMFKYVLLAIAIFVQVAPCQEYSGLRPVDRLFQTWGGPGYEACTEDGRLYLSESESIVVFDLSDPENLLYLGTSYLESGGYGRFSVINSTAFFSNRSSLVAYDLHNPELPVLLSELEFEHIPKSLCADENRLYISTFDSLIFVCDIADPEDMRILGSARTDFILNHVRYDAELELLFGDGDRLQGFDVSDVDNITRSLDLDYQTRDFATDGHYVYIATVEDELRIVDLSEHGRLHEVGHFRFDGVYPSTIECIVLHNNCIYAGYGTYTYDFGNEEYQQAVIYGIDVSDPTVPTLEHVTGSYPGGFQTFALIGDLLAYSQDQLYIVNPDVWGHETIKTPEGVGDMCVADDNLFTIASYSDSRNYFLSHLDISDPENTTEISSLELEGVQDRQSYLEIEVSPPQVFILNNNDGSLKVAGWNQNHPLSLTDLSYQFPAHSSNMEIKNDFLFMLYNGNQGNGMTIMHKGLRSGLINVSIDADVNNMWLTDEYAYICTRSNSVVVVDISNLAQCRVIGQFQTRNNGTCAAVKDDILYISDGDLNLFDLSDPARPNLIDCIEFDGAVRIKNISGNHLFLTQEIEGRPRLFDYNLVMFDITDPVHPVETGRQGIRITPHNLYLDESYLFSSDFYEMTVYDCSEALGIEAASRETATSSFILNPAFPNPFNSSTTVSFNIPSASKVNAGLYDLQGRRIMDLASNSYMKSGMNEIRINASDLSAGSYMLKVEIGKQAQDTKLIYVK